MTDLERVDQLIAEIKARFAPNVPPWEPSETNPIRRKYEFKRHEQKLGSLANTAKLQGLEVKEEFR